MKDTGKGVKGLIINNNNEFLCLVKPDGTFDLAGGRVEHNDGDCKKALNREIKEEIGRRAKVHNLVAEWFLISARGALITGKTYLCYYLGGNISLSNEHSSHIWLSYNQMIHSNLARYLM